MKKRFSIAAICLFATQLLYLAAPAVSEPTVDLHVSQNFSATLFSQAVERKEGDAVVDLLLRSMPVQTSYSGGFVTQIKGIPADLSSTKKENWFYYVNSVLADVGASGYKPTAGDSVWWDFHPWSDDLMVSATIGQFPEPFRSGYKGRVLPTRVLFTPAQRAAAEQFGTALKQAKVTDVSLETFTGNIPSDTEHYYVLIGNWGDVASAERLKSASGAPGKSGLFARINNQKHLVFSKLQGGELLNNNGGAFVVALNSSFQTTPVWLFSGSSDEFVAKLVARFVERPSDFKYLVAAALQNDKVSAVPVVE